MTILNGQLELAWSLVFLSNFSVSIRRTLWAGRIGVHFIQAITLLLPEVIKMKIRQRLNSKFHFGKC